MVNSETTPFDIFVRVLVASPEELTEYAKIVGLKSITTLQRPTLGYLLLQWIDYYARRFLYLIRIRGESSPITPNSFNMIVNMSGRIRLARKIITKFHSEEAWNSLIDSLLSQWQELTPQELARRPEYSHNASYDEKLSERIYSHIKSTSTIQELKHILNEPFP